jgi:molybdopterin synthase catalytic subunit
MPSGASIRLLSFGSLRSALPAGGLTRALPAEPTVAALLTSLREDGVFPAEALRSAAIAVNHEYASPDRRLADGDEVAILPPVSGGSVHSEAFVPVQLVNEPIEAEPVMKAIKSGGDGAVCVFDGIVRDNTRGRPTLHLDYEAYEEMALKQMRALREDALGRFAVREIAIIHRLGRLFVGETSVLIVVAAAHRGAAFDACRYVIDTLKKTVPIWKQEQFADGVVWADGEPFPDDIARADAGAAG